jgi:hypothetical protein
VSDVQQEAKASLDCMSNRGSVLLTLTTGLLLLYLLDTACTEALALIVGAVPERVPLQFTKDLPAGGVAMSATKVP